MISEREMRPAPKPGDRVIVVFSDGHVHTSGVLVAISEGYCFIHCDAYNPERGEWPATFRIDQTRHEDTITDKVEVALTRLHENTRRRWNPFSKKDRAHNEQMDKDYGLAMNTLREIERHFNAPNVADQILHETPDGLRKDDPVNIYDPTSRGGHHGKGRFIAEYRGIRYVVWDSGSPTGYPASCVTLNTGV
jgi:hypothetical protein